MPRDNPGVGTDGHSVCNCQELEVNQTSAQAVVCPHRGILFSKKKKKVEDNFGDSRKCYAE